MYRIEKTNARRIGAGVAVMSMLLLLSACGTRHVSRDVSPEGQAGEVVFPSVDSVVLEEGTFPNPENLRAVGAGVNKDQLYDLIGRPHFRESFNAREWDYLFNFRQADGSVVTCQYKVIFDRAYLGQSFHWAPASCADQLTAPAAAAAAAAAVPVQETRLEISADALFAFAKSGSGDILDHGRQQLATIADRLMSAEDVQVRVVGHTDRIGSEAANRGLSQRRAETVGRFFVERGIPATAVRAEGRGESDPATTACGDALPRRALIECLRTDRRVELFVRGIETK